MFAIQPTFKDAVDMILGAGDLNVLRQNVALIDALSYRQTNGFDSSSGGGTPTPGAYPSAPPFRVWYGFLRFRSDVTALTITGRISFASTVSLKVYLNGNATAAATITSPQTSFTSTITISSLGYADGQIIPIEIRATGSGSTATGTVVITGIYATPITMSGWPGVPTFTTATVNAAKLNQLASAIAWCYNRMALVPILPQRGCIRQLGSFRNGVTPIWYGSVVRNFTEDILRIQAYITNPYTPSWRYKVYINQSLAYTSDTYGAGDVNIYLPLTLSGVSVGNTAEVSFIQEVLDQGNKANWVFSRWSLHYARTNPSGNVYPAASLPTAFAHGSLSATTLVSRLDSLATIVAAVKARIDAAPHLWERGYAVRSWYGWDDNTRGVLPQRAPLHFNRRGSRLVVRGKDVKIAWGVPTTPIHEQGFLDYDNYEFPSTQQIIEGDKVDTKEVYLDSFSGVFVGVRYYLIGDVSYAEELQD
jgi:hypothetical protein